MAGQWAIVAAGFGGAVVAGLIQWFVAREAAKASDGRWLLQETKTAYSALLDETVGAQRALKRADIDAYSVHHGGMERAVSELTVLGQPDVFDRFRVMLATIKQINPRADRDLKFMWTAVVHFEADLLTLASARFRDVPGYRPFIRKKKIDWEATDARQARSDAEAARKAERTAEHRTNANEPSS